MSKPKPPKKSQLSTFDEADATLRHLGGAQRTVVALKQEAQAEIDRIKARLARDLEVPAAVAAALTRQLKAFVEAHQPEIEARGAKTVQLQFGRVGMRTPPASLRLEKGFTEDDVIARIKVVHKRDADVYLRVVESLRRDQLALLDEEDLAQLGLRQEQDESVVIEPAVDVAEPIVEVA